MKLEKCHGRKPYSRKIKKLKMWLISCGCRCDIYKVGAPTKKEASQVWSLLINQNTITDD